MIAHLGVGLEAELRLDTRGPEAGAHLHAAGLEPRPDGRHQDLGLGGAEGLAFRLSLGAHPRLEDREDALDSHAHPDGRDVLAGEHAHQAVVAPPRGDGPHPRPDEDCLVDEPGVVVQPAGEAEVEGDVPERVHRAEEAEQGFHLVQRLHHLRVSSHVPQQRRRARAQVSQQLDGAVLEGDDLAYLVRRRAVQALVLHHLAAHLRPRLLVQLVDRAADRPELLRWHAADLHHAVQDAPMVELHDELPEVQLS